MWKYKKKKEREEKKATEKQSVSLKVKAAAVSGRVCNIARIRLYLSFRRPTLFFFFFKEGKNKSECGAREHVCRGGAPIKGGRSPLNKQRVAPHLQRGLHLLRQTQL